MLCCFTKKTKNKNRHGARYDGLPLTTAQQTVIKCSFQSNAEMRGTLWRTRPGGGKKHKTQNKQSSLHIIWHICSQMSVVEAALCEHWPTGAPHLSALIGFAEDLQVVVQTVSWALEQQSDAVVQDLLCSRQQQLRLSFTEHGTRCSLHESLHTRFVKKTLRNIVLYSCFSSY